MWCFIPLDIWEHNLTTHKWKYGHHYIWASYFYMLEYYLEQNDNAALKAADMLYQLKYQNFDFPNEVRYLLFIHE